MSIKSVLSKLNFAPSEAEIGYLKAEAKKFLSLLEGEIKKQRVKAEAFVGGSFAKSTLVEKEKQDIDVFVRFDWRYDDISDMLERILKNIARKAQVKIKRVHGSRDYFNAEVSRKLAFEVVPVTRIKKPKEARNVTDLSYFHVNYVKKKMNKNAKLAREIVLAKTFCRAQNAYGAESYIRGFSGYGVECLIIAYGSFEKMARELAKAETGERIVLDPEKYYKSKNEVLFELNESKIGSPIVLVDPTWKERNVLAGLSAEKFEKFQIALKNFLKHPSEKFFEMRGLDVKALESEAKKKKAEFLHIKLKTDRQEGDIAGTKMKKFADFIASEIEPYFEIIKKEFAYDEGQEGDAYYIAKSKKEIVKTGPPLKMAKHALAFRKANKNVYEKNGILHAKIIISGSAKEFARKLIKKLGNKIKEMDVTGIKVA